MLRIAGAREDGFSYEIRLVHADPDLCVALAEANDDWDIHAEWRLWARVLGLPALVERVEGRDEPDRPMLGKVAVAPPAPRRRGKTITARRARFLTRRKVGRPELCAQVDRRARANCSAAPIRSGEAPHDGAALAPLAPLASNPASFATGPLWRRRSHRIASHWR